MAEKWYPVIDYTLYEECGSCIQKCAHGTFDKAKAPTPVVINPQACVDRCHGCGNLCPAGAIIYVGDDTGWTPPHSSGKQENAASCCEPGGCCCG